MSRDINPKDAATWSKEELEDNLRYLQDRGRDEDIAEIIEVAKSKKGKNKKDDEE